MRPTGSEADWLPGSGNSGQILNQSRGYDNAGNVTSVSTTFAAVPGLTGSGGSEVQNFCYDEQNRLIWSGNAGTQPGAGNGTCGSGTLSSTLTNASYTAPFTYTNLGQIWTGPLNGKGSAQQYLYCNSAPHELTGIYPSGTTCATKGSATAGYSASYDAWGNETSRTYNGATDTLAYDALNRLTTYSDTRGASEQYVYDASGNRVLKRSTSAGTTTLSVYPSSNEEYDYSSTGTLTSQLHYYTLSGYLIASFDGTNTTYYLTDALGSVLMSFSNNAILGEQIYGPYGNTRYTAGTINTTKGYTGQIQDSVTGLDYYNARYYDPVVGRFLSVDSVQGNQQGMDPYTYVGGNPETLTDPTGNCPFCIAIPILAAVAEAAADVVGAVVAVVAAPIVITAVLVVAIVVLGGLIIYNATKKEYQPNDGKHKTTRSTAPNGQSSGAEPTNAAKLVDEAIKVPGEGNKWIVYDPETGEIIVYTGGQSAALSHQKWHSHVETWKELRGKEKAVLTNEGIFDDKGHVNKSWVDKYFADKAAEAERLAKEAQQAEWKRLEWYKEIYGEF